MNGRAEPILKIEAMGGGRIPYLGYIKMHLQIPGVKASDEDILMLVLEDGHAHRLGNHSSL